MSDQVLGWLLAAAFISGLVAGLLLSGSMRWLFVAVSERLSTNRYIRRHARPKRSAKADSTPTKDTAKHS